MSSSSGAQRDYRRAREIYDAARRTYEERKEDYDDEADGVRRATIAIQRAQGNGFRGESTFSPLPWFHIFPSKNGNPILLEERMKYLAKSLRLIFPLL